MSHYSYLHGVSLVHNKQKQMSRFSPSTPHYVYIINQPLQNKKFVCKIGFTKDANQRVKGLQVGSDKKLSVFKTFKVGYNRTDAYQAEQKVQRMFKAFKREGEWFAFNPVYLVNEVIPQIENFVNGLDVKDEPLPITKVANALMTKEQYMKVKTRQVVLSSKKSLTLEQQLELVICDNALARERNLEKIISKEKMLAKAK